MCMLNKSHHLCIPLLYQVSPPLENKGYEHLRVDESLVQIKINSAALTAKAAAGTS